ncbi:MAG: 4Fe-4S binding protein [Deferribacterota bacterium]|nr:4Fe-4S binding protein [Deferribacterota bacterium]
MFNKLTSLNNTIKTISQNLFIDPNRCLNFISKYKPCSICTQNCQNNAINIDKDNKLIEIDDSKCSECGVCVTKCPTKTFDFKFYRYYKLISKINEFIVNNKDLIFICKQFYEKNNSLIPHNNLTYLIEIPCTSIIDFTILIHIANNTNKPVTILCDCKNCINSVGNKIFLDNKELAYNFIKNFKDVKLSVEIINDTDYIKNIIGNNNKAKKEIPYLSRRELFGYFRKESINSAKDLLTLFISKKELKENRKILHSKYIPLNRVLLIKNLKAMKLNSKNAIFDTANSIELTSIEIDFNKCSLCRLCYIFCPTGALSEKTIRDEDGKLKKVGINVAINKCIKCGFCIFICPNKAISYNNKLMLDELIN